jgi:hypothetical protein
MKPSHPITIHWRQTGQVITHAVPEGDYILRSFEQQGDPICRIGFDRPDYSKCVFRRGQRADTDY